MEQHDIDADWCGRTAARIAEALIAARLFAPADATQLSRIAEEQIYSALVSGDRPSSDNDRYLRPHPSLKL